MRECKICKQEKKYDDTLLVCMQEKFCMKLEEVDFSIKIRNAYICSSCFNAMEELSMFNDYYVTIYKSELDIEEFIKIKTEQVNQVLKSMIK